MTYMIFQCDCGMWGRWQDQGSHHQTCSELSLRLELVHPPTEECGRERYLTELGFPDPFSDKPAA